MSDTAPQAQDRRRRLPAVDRLLRHPQVQEAIALHGQRLVTRCVRDVLTAARQHYAALEHGAGHTLEFNDALEFDEETLSQQVLERLAARQRPNARPVFNLTGTVIHTNLGRALLSENAIKALERVARAPVALEYDLGDGERGDRDDLIEGLLCELTGAEAATVVNNNAAAVVLTLGALGAGREAIVSRGELIEIGGAFRMPDIMAAAGCQLREVGTTNRTHPNDYQQAIGEQSGLVVKVYASNYAIEGFTTSVGEHELATIAHTAGLPLVVDLGSGALIDLAALGLPHETLPSDAIAAGADVVTFSGDKLLGGPQAGIIVGRREYIDHIKRHPLKRAMRLDKLVLAALEATLRHYRDDDHPERHLPTLRLLCRDEADIRATGERLLARLDGRFTDFTLALDACMSQLGSGSLPVDRLPSVALVWRSIAQQREARERALRQLTNRLRSLERPVIGRLKEGALWLDLRCLEAHDEALLLSQLISLNEAREHR